MDEILDILENQKEVKYLTYFIHRDGFDNIVLILGTAGIERKCKFLDENDCLNKLVDILLKLGGLEKWTLKRNKDG